MRQWSLSLVRFRAIAVALAALLVIGLLAAPAIAQSPPHPNGCSIAGGVQWIQQGLDRLFLGACNRHDQCWAQCNSPDPPYLGLAHKLQCDATFFVEMEAACVAIAATLSFPLDDIDNAEDFLEVCATATAAFSAAVASPLTIPLFNTSQCIRGCNTGICGFTPLPPCGVTRCYVDTPPFPPLDSCLFVDCTQCVGPAARRCCSDCEWPPDCV